MQTRILETLFACTAISFAAVGLADTSVQEYALEIARQPIKATLHELSKQTGLDVSFVVKSDDQADLLVGPLKGHYTVEAALNELLEDSGLTFTRVSASTIAVTARDGKRAGLVSGANSRTKNDSKPRFQQLADLAVVDETAKEIGIQRAAAVSTEDSKSAAERVNRSTRDKDIEEVVVTAQRRTERLQDVPISISVMSGVELDRSPGAGVVDALNHVPGVTASVLPQSGTAFVTLRGVASGANVGAGGQTAGYYLDSMPFNVGIIGSTAPDTSAYDLSRVEVLRGPQGTLYGVSSVSGVVRILTNDTNLEQFEAKGRLSTSLTSGAGTNYRGDAAINVPIVEGRLAARAVMGYEDQSGWVDRPNKEDINDGTLRNVRLKIGARPLDNLQMTLSAWHSDTDYDATAAANDAGTRNVLFDEPLTIDMDLYALALSYDFASFSLSSNTSKLQYDYDGLKRSIFSANFLNTVVDASIFSQEINLSSTVESPFRWSLGAIYTDSERWLYQRSGPITTVRSATLTFANAPHLTSESAAAFGQVDYRFVDTLEVTLGLRYFHDEVTQIRTLTAPREAATFHATTPRVGLTWYPSDDLTAYAVYAQGFRSGTLQNAATPVTFAGADPDRLHNYEVGVKGELFDGRVSFDTAVYYMKWDDVQQSLLVPVGVTFTGVVINGTSASGPGFEMSTLVRPAEGLNVGLTFGWNDLTFDKTVFSGGVALHEKGARLNASAEYTYGAFMNYSLPLGASGLEAHLSASASYQSELISRTPIGSNILTIAGDPILVGRASLSVGPTDSRWGVTLFADNVTNEEGATLGGWPPPGQADEGSRLRPRTFGAQLECKF